MTAMIEKPVLPPVDPAEQRALDALAALVATPMGATSVSGAEGVAVVLPAAIREVLARTVAAMRAGRAIAVEPVAQRLTTQEAADLLGVSRPTLIKLLDQGEIPFERPGNHRRVRLMDVLDYQERCRMARGRALDELVSLTEDLGLYDDDGVEGDR
ncbi:MAG: helix-turn-helix domain-containing protein [Micromonosporaceae bacterium]|nr:helix-turn-helix domain-containing protein [Micromonosporaceae bacterium]